MSRSLKAPAGDGLFLRAAEADSFHGLVAAILDDPGYEAAEPEGRLLQRLRLADDVVLLAEVAGAPKLTVSDRGGDGVIDVSSDERFIRSFGQGGLRVAGPRPQRHPSGRPLIRSETHQPLSIADHGLSPYRPTQAIARLWCQLGMAIGS